MSLVCKEKLQIIQILIQEREPIIVTELWVILTVLFRCGKRETMSSLDDRERDREIDVDPDSDRCRHRYR